MPQADTDWILQALVSSAEQTGTGTSLTVFCGGLAVSGTVVSEEMYFQHIGLPDLASRASDAAHAAERIRAEAEVELDRPGLSPERRASSLQQIERLGPQFLMMVDVTILGVTEPPLRSSAWRGRLSQITSWVIGGYAPA